MSGKRQKTRGYHTWLLIVPSDHLFQYELPDSFLSAVLCLGLQMLERMCQKTRQFQTQLIQRLLFCCWLLLPSLPWRGSVAAIWVAPCFLNIKTEPWSTSPARFYANCIIATAALRISTWQKNDDLWFSSPNYILNTFSFVKWWCEWTMAIEVKMLERIKVSEEWF